MHAIRNRSTATTDLLADPLHKPTGRLRIVFSGLRRIFAMHGLEGQSPNDLGLKVARLHRPIIQNIDLDLQSSVLDFEQMT